MLDWTKCVSVCIDSARSMSGSYRGLQSLIRSKAPDAPWTHCIIHREALASKYLSLALNQILEYVVNFIKTRPLKSRFFKKIYDDMGTEVFCTTVVHDGSFVVMFYHVRLNYGKKFIYSLKDTKMPMNFLTKIF